MKTTIYDLLGRLKNNNAPRSVYYKGDMYKYDETSNDYWCNELDSGTRWLFDEYVITDILNDEVIIYEDHTTYKPDKIEKIDIYDSYTNHNNLHTYINTYDKDGKIKRFVISAPQREIIMKINEIIDKVKNL